MASKAIETEGRDESFWREFPAMTGYFAPGMVPLLKYQGLDSKQGMHEFGEQLGRKAAAKTANLSLDQMLDEFARVWRAYKIGTIAGRKPQPDGHPDLEMYRVRPARWDGDGGELRMRLP